MISASDGRLLQQQDRAHVEARCVATNEQDTTGINYVRDIDLRLKKVEQREMW
jgi:hypothetical protein